MISIYSKFEFLSSYTSGFPKISPFNPSKTPLIFKVFKFYNFYITQEGLINFGVSFIRILNLILMSWLINEMKLLTGRFSKYQKIIDTVIDLVPEVFTLFKKRMKAKNFTRYILKDISKRYE